MLKCRTLHSFFMPTLERQQIYVPDSLVKLAREKGMTNLSGFVRDSLKEYIDTGIAPTTATLPAVTPKGGQ